MEPELKYNLIKIRLPIENIYRSCFLYRIIMWMDVRFKINKSVHACMTMNINSTDCYIYRHYVHTCLIIIGSDDSCWSRHIQLNNGLRHINTFNLYITHTGYHSEIHVYTICYQVHAGSSTKSKLSAILITLLGVFTSQLLN